MNSGMNRLFTLLASAALASCASSTMDSIPDSARMAQFREVAQRNLSSEYESLAAQRSAGTITEQAYQAGLVRLNERALSDAHTLAFESHDMAERQRKARGEPTPDLPVYIEVPGGGGGDGQSLFRSARQQYNMANGVGGGTNIAPSLPASGLGGAMSRGNYPGSIYDEPGN